MEFLVSIIIPVYKCEKYIKDCLLSVINQSYKNIEVIIIDDKGQDDSIKIAEKILGNSKLMYTIIDQKVNRGVSYARNTGINISNGKYIFFLDADDMISPNCIEELFLCAERTESDLVMGEYIRNREIEEYKDLLKIENINNVSIKNIKYDEVCNYYCNNIIKRNFIVDNNIYFDCDLNLGEDIFWMMQVQFRAKKMIKLNSVTYYYRINIESSSFRLGSGIKYIENLIELVDAMYLYSQDKDISNKERAVIISRVRMFKNAIYSTAYADKIHSKQFDNNKLNKIRFGINPVIRSNLSNSKKLLELMFSIFPILDSIPFMKLIFYLYSVRRREI